MAKLDTHAHTHAVTLTHPPLVFWRSDVLQDALWWCQQRYVKTKLYWQGCWRWTAKKNMPSGQQSTKNLSFLNVGASVSMFVHYIIYISSENLQTPNAREGWGVILIWVNKVKAWQWKQINHADGWSLKLHKHLKSSQRWFVLSIIYIWPRNEKWWEGSHVINNKIDVDNKPISEQHHWWFVIYFF